MAAFTDKLPPPFDKHKDDYTEWKQSFEFWQVVTECADNKQGALLMLRLDNDTRASILQTVTNAEVKSPEGIKKILDEMDKLFKGDTVTTSYEAYEAFELYRRPQNMPIKDYCKEFQKKLKKVNDAGCTLPDCIIACRLLKSANLSETQEQLLKATCKMTYDDLSTQMKKIFVTEAHGSSSEVRVKEEPIDYLQQDTLYGKYNRYHKADKWNRKSGFSNNSEQRINRDNRKGNNMSNSEKEKKAIKKRGRNPLDQYGRVTRCIHCESINHWIKDCPDMTESEHRTFLECCEKDQGEVSDADEDDTGETSETYLMDHAAVSTEEFFDPTKITLTCSTMNAATLDCGAPKTVCGRTWLRHYIDSLSESDKKKIEYGKSNNIYKFGCGSKFPAVERVCIPALIGKKKVTIQTDVVEGDIPLLFSKESMKKTGASLNFKDDKLSILGQIINLDVTESGHYTLPLGNDRQVIADIYNDSETRVNLTLTNEQKSTIKTATKLHRQFAHPSSERLVKLVRNQGGDWEELIKAIYEVTKNCKICKLYKRPPPRPVVGFPMAHRFGQCVAMDLKQFGKVHLLHAIDHATRLAAASIIRSKSPEVIIRDVFRHWVSIYGVPEMILSDNGGEFNNSQVRELGEKLNLKLKTTAAESPWSNGLVERHNLILGEMIVKTQADTGCSLEMATMWSVTAHNSLTNVYGFTPFQLVFGRNPVLPSLQTDKPPALSEETSCEVIRNNLNAMHAARQAHIRNESSEKVRRALRHNVRTTGEIRYVTGDSVYYKRKDSKKWKGPGTVLGSEGNQVLVKHQGI